MNSLLKMWQFPFANYDQTINPITTWFSPQYALHIKGDAAVEAEIQTQVASFGSQLGTLIDAVLELAGDQPGEKLDCVRKLQGEVEEIKSRHTRDRCKKLQGDLRRLKAEEPEAFAQLMRSIS